MATTESRERGGAAETDARCHFHFDSGETHMGKEQEVNEATEDSFCGLIHLLFFSGPPGSHKLC